jgi:hypothetical protein
MWMEQKEARGAAALMSTKFMASLSTVFLPVAVSMKACVAMSAYLPQAAEQKTSRIGR